MSLEKPYWIQLVYSDGVAPVHVTPSLPIRVPPQGPQHHTTTRVLPCTRAAKTYQTARSNPSALWCKTSSGLLMSQLCSIKFGIPSCGNTTPLGTPVEPLVKYRIAAFLPLAGIGTLYSCSVTRQEKGCETLMVWAYPSRIVAKLAF